MKLPRYTDVRDLPRNNPTAALETRRYMIAVGTWRPEYTEALIHLQDRPNRLLAALQREK